MEHAVALVRRRLQDLRPGAARRSGNLTVVPLHAAPPQGPRNYLLLPEAFDAGAVEITETGQDGEVSELMFHNRGDRPVLLLEGQVLLGAKQHRVLNTSLLVHGRTSHTIPVSCVERGRWSRASATFSLGSHASPRLRSILTRSVSKSVRAARQRGDEASAASYRSDQGKVWLGVTHMLAGTNTRSPSDSYHDAVTRSRKGVEDLQGAFDDALENATGMAVFVGDRFVGLDAVSHPEVFDRVRRRLLDGAALEALADDAGADAPDGNASATVRSLLDRLGAADAVSSPSLGEGEDVRFEVPGALVGAALTADETVLQISAFGVDPEDA